MKSAIKTELTNLDRVTATLVTLLGSTGLYHYNKLTYLFEYFFIKNFGTRYTGEFFIKLPHGPVIKDYKKQISRLNQLGIISVDEEELHAKRRLVDDFYFSTVEVFRTSKTEDSAIKESIVFSLIEQIVNKYGNLSIAELESVVYQTKPVLAYKNSVEKRLKRTTGGYVLKNDCLKISDHKNPVTSGREVALRHIKRYPTIDFQQQKIHADEMASLSLMRPVF